jgi:hypothetical protein
LGEIGKPVVLELVIQEPGFSAKAGLFWRSRRLNWQLSASSEESSLSAHQWQSAWVGEKPRMGS